ncbi:MAG TPA: tetratricopeptide repeat protein, partial [Longimicrobium sp.]|nr:tetratricopeptide repeat protein [Longimicrobium sp.]
MADLSPELAARIQSLESSYADNPGRYFVALAGAWREAGETGRAEEILRENLKRFPGLSAHVLLGRCLADRGAYQEAANEFHYVLSIDAQNLIALRTLAEMAAATGRRAEAERWYNELLAVDPMNAEARAALQELARGGADASVADQPAQTGSGWGGAAEPLDVAGGADSGDADEFGMIDLAPPPADSAADASGVAADDELDEWGDLSLDLPPQDESPAGAAAPAGDFDAFGFGSVDLDTPSGAPEVDETGGLDAWMDADARQDRGLSTDEDRGALAPLEDETLLDAPTAGAGLPFLDADGADDTVAADLPLLDTGHAAAPDFPGFDAPSHDDAFSFAADAPLPAFEADADADGHADQPVDAEVVTETMAELYAAQGLLQQSADTYRELIRQRGEEPGLVRRLAEIEARLHPAAEPAAEEEEAPDWLASVDAFAMGGAAAGLAAVHMSAEEEPEPEPVDAPPAPADAAPQAPFADVANADDADVLAPAEATTPVADFVPPPPPVETAAAASPEAGGDSFADSFAGGFEGVEAPAAEPAFAGAPAGSVETAGTADAGDSGREPWETPSVHETEPVGFDLIVVEEDGGEVPAPPEVVADVSADWAIAAAPLGDDEEAAEEEMAAASAPRAGSMSVYFSSLLAWQPGQSAAAAAAKPPAPAFDDVPTAVEPATDDTPRTHTATAEPLAAEEPWAKTPSAAEPVIAEDEPWAAPSTGAEEEPWAETPAAPAANVPVYDDAPAADAVPAEPEVAEDEPWAAPAADAAPATDAAADIP